MCRGVRRSRLLVDGLRAAVRIATHPRGPIYSGLVTCTFGAASSTNSFNRRALPDANRSPPPLIGRCSVLLLGLASGCSSSGANEDPPAPTTEQLRQVGQRVPAFGGVQFGDDRLVVFVLEEKVGVAREVLRDISGLAGAAIDLRARPVKGDGSESLKESARRVLSVEAVNSLYYNEINGYVYVGYVGLTRVDALRPEMQKLTGLGIPLDAVILQVQYPIFFF